MKQLRTGVLRLSLRSSSSNGIKFKSKHRFNLPPSLDFLRMDKESESLRFNKPPLMAVLCFLMCPPRACPMANSSPQMGQGCILGCCFVTGLGNVWWWHERSVIISLGFLWLALCPPSAWKEENLRLQVLHLKSPTSLSLNSPQPFDVGLVSLTPTLVNSIKQLVMFSNSPSSLLLFILMGIVGKNIYENLKTLLHSYIYIWTHEMFGNVWGRCMKVVAMTVTWSWELRGESGKSTLVFPLQLRIERPKHC